MLSRSVSRNVWRESHSFTFDPMIGWFWCRKLIKYAKSYKCTKKINFFIGASTSSVGTLTLQSKSSFPVAGKNIASIPLINKSAAINMIGTTQNVSIKNPKTKLPRRAPTLPIVAERAAAITLKLVGKRSTIMQYTTLIPKLVRASKIHDRRRFWLDVCTKYRPTVTPPLTNIQNTRKNLAPSLWTQSGSHRLVGMQARPMIKVCEKTELSMVSVQCSMALMVWEELEET